MGVFFWGKRKRHEKLAVVFDIGNASVGAALVSLTSRKLPQIFYTTRRDIPHSREIDASKLAKNMATTLEKVARDVTKEGFPHARFTFLGSLKPASVLFTLANPWHTSQTRIIRRRSETPFPVTRELVRDMVYQDLENFRKTYAREALNRGRGEQYEIIEADILDIRLNRYRVEHPTGQLTHDLELTLFTSVGNRDVIHAIEAAGGAEFLESETRFSSFVFSAFAAIRDIWHDDQHFLFIDISGEITELAIVKDGRLLETASFPIGRNTLIRRIALAEGVSMEEAFSLFTMYRDKRLHERSAKKIVPIVGDAVDEWLKLFSKEIEGISAQILLPQKVFLMADEPVGHLFKDILSSNRITHLSPVARPFTTVLLDGKTLAPYCELKNPAIADPFLILESIFLSRKLGMV